MKVSEFSFNPRVLRLPMAEMYVGGQQNLKNLTKAGWVEPFIRHKSNTSFDIKDLDRAIDRVKLEGWEKVLRAVNAKHKTNS